MSLFRASRLVRSASDRTSMIGTNRLEHMRDHPLFRPKRFLSVNPALGAVLGFSSYTAYAVASAKFGGGSHGDKHEDKDHTKSGHQ